MKSQTTSSIGITLSIRHCTSLLLWRFPLVLSALLLIQLQYHALPLPPALPSQSALPLPPNQPLQLVDPVVVDFDKENRTVSITITSNEGHLKWSDILRGIAKAKGFDSGALKGVLPEKSLNINKISTRLIFVGLNMSLRPSLHFLVSSPGKGANSTLTIKLDKNAFFATRRRLKKMLRDKILSTGTDFGSRDFGIEFNKDWKKAPKDKKLLVLVHGLNSAPENIDAILKHLRELDVPCSVFRYPNDQAITESARLFAEELEKIKTAQPSREVAVLSSSMGGLVAREALENPDLDPKNVTQLIMVSPPNHGSSLARFSFAVDWFEHLKNDPGKGTEKRSVRSKVVQRFYAALEDGLGEAANDLEPGSKFLKKLNSRKRNPRIKYTIFLGTGALLTHNDLNMMREWIKKTGGEYRFVQFFGKKLDTYMKDMDEVVGGEGDGVVSVARGKLTGVEDIVILPYNHLTALQDLKLTGPAKLRQEILLRLEPGQK